MAPVGGPEMPGTSAPQAEHTCWWNSTCGDGTQPQGTPRPLDLLFITLSPCHPGWTQEPGLSLMLGPWEPSGPPLPPPTAVSESGQRRR